MQKKYIAFSLPIKKELDNGKTITYKKLQIALDLCLPHYQDFVDNLLYKCKKCKKRWLKSVNGLIKKFPNVHNVCDGNTKKFILVLRKGVYPYEYMNSWGRFKETSLLDKNSFYSELNLEDITDKDYVHYQKVSEEFKLKDIGDYHDLFV